MSMARTINFDQLFSHGRQEKIIKIELEVATNSVGLKRQIRRTRHQEEARLLVRAVKESMVKLKREGKLIIDGRKWKFHF
jgi:hypothetical protein